MPARAGDFAAIEGKWEFEGGSVTVAPAGDQDHFSGTVVRPTRFSSCVHPRGQVMWDIRGSGDHYVGEHIGFTDPSTCEPMPGFGATWDVIQSSDGPTLHTCLTSPNGQETNCYDLTQLKRAQHPPIVFVHGFLGSGIACGDDDLWPAAPRPEFREMRLAADGVRNFQGGSACNRAAASTGRIVRSVAGVDVYGGFVDYLRELPRVKIYVFVYDWRKSPGLAVDDLNRLVNRARSETGHPKVVLAAHSMGGLVSRWYLESQNRASKVARVVTMGTPFWGSPKPYLALSRGWTTPEDNGLDAIINDGDLRSFAPNATGAYFLYPSPAYHQVVGPWLTYKSGVSDPFTLSETYEEIERRGGNLELLTKAHDKHEGFLDVYTTSGVDLQMVVGTGIKTVSLIRENHRRPNDPPSYAYSNGDGTVGTMSASAGLEQSSLSGYVHYVCNIGHAALPGSATVQNLIKGFLLRGDPIAYPTRCDI